MQFLELSHLWKVILCWLEITRHVPIRFTNVTKPQKLADSHILQFKTVDNAWVLQQQETIIIDMEDLAIVQAQKVDQWPTTFGELNSVKSLNSFFVRISKGLLWNTNISFIYIMILISFSAWLQCANKRISWRQIVVSLFTKQKYFRFKTFTFLSWHYEILQEEKKFF